MFSRTMMFQRLVGGSTRTSNQFSLRDALQAKLSFLNAETSSSASDTPFGALSDTSRVELLQAIQSMELYGHHSRKSNERRRNLFRKMSWRQQKLCKDAGYLSKLNKIDDLIDENQKVFTRIANATKLLYQVSTLDATFLRVSKSFQNTSSSNYRVVEALGHFVRDWASLDEVSPMLSYITSQLDAFISPEEAKDTCIVIPGSGLGRIAHEIALYRDYAQVHAVEFSGLMHACHQFMYSGDSDTPRKFSIYPYISSCSNYVTTDSQVREVSIDGKISKPSCLSLHLDDFRYFEIPNREKYKHVVVVSAFFIDTAENLIDYLDQIRTLTSPSKDGVRNGYWINFGPLKYGSAAQSELNADEVAFVRKQMGWKDVDSACSLTSPLPDLENGLYPYITDQESMWQGFYGTSRWSSEHPDNLG